MHREAFGLLGAGADINAMLIFRVSSLMFHAKHLHHCVSLDSGAHDDEHLVSGFKIFEKKELRLVLLMHTQTSPCIAVSSPLVLQPYKHVRSKIRKNVSFHSR